LRRSLFVDGDLLYCKEQQGNISAEREKDVFYSVKVTSLVDITLVMPPSCNPQRMVLHQTRRLQSIILMSPPKEFLSDKMPKNKMSFKILDIYQGFYLNSFKLGFRVAG
jgi:hypothetical protein